MPAPTSTRNVAINNIKAKALTAAAIFGGRQLVLTNYGRNPRNTRSPHTRFVIETKSAASLAAIRKVVARILGGPDALASGVSWKNRQLIVPSTGVATLQVNAAFDVRFMFPGADPQDQRFKLANFVVLTLPIEP